MWVPIFSNYFQFFQNVFQFFQVRQPKNPQVLVTSAWDWSARVLPFPHIQSHQCPPNFGCSPEFWGKPVFPRNFPRISQFPPNFLNLFIKSVKITQSPPNLPDFPLKLLKILYVNCYSIIRLLNIRQLDKWKNKIIIAFWWKCEDIFHNIGLH